MGKKLQECQLDILKRLIDTLDANGFRYYLAFGSLIGAVRHHGFIPWDDDVDIFMPRNDYDKFAKVANDLLPNGYFYQDKTTDAEYPYGFAKVRKDGTLFVQKPVAKFKMHQGVYVDIFPLDGCGDNEKAGLKLIKKCHLLHYISMVDALVDSDTTQSFKKKLEIFALKTMRLLIGKKRISSVLYKKSTKYDFDNSKYVGCMVGSMCEKYVIPKEYFYTNDTKYSIVNFEDVDVKAPANTDACLRLMYGDYMELPPEDKRVSFHQVIEEKY